MDDYARDRARLRRKNWVARWTTLEGQTSAPTASTAQERLACMWDLAREGWILARGELPDYDRHEIPGALVTDELE